MASGLPKSYIKKYGITKKAWREYRKSKKGTTSRTRKASPSRRKGVRRLTRRKRRARRKKTIPILPIAGAASIVMIPPATSGGGKPPYQAAMDGEFNWAIEGIIENSTGYNVYTKNWDLNNAHGLKAFAISLIAHKAIGWLGGNRIFANMPAPFNKLRL